MNKNLLNLLINIGLALLTPVSIWLWWHYDVVNYPPVVRYLALALALAVIAGMIVYDWMDE